MKKVLITGGAGFIGSHAVQYLTEKYPKAFFVNLDKLNILNYEGSIYEKRLKCVEDKKNYKFIKGDICDSVFIKGLFEKYKFDTVFHLAAESSVDNSISDVHSFVFNNIVGTSNLLRAAHQYWKNNKMHKKRFVHVSTDEVYGSLDEYSKERFNEHSFYQPRNPYSASKASSDHLVYSFYNTYGFPAIITHCSNNFGPLQGEGKLIPEVMKSIFDNDKISVYGKGEQIRDWIYVEDHIEALDKIRKKGKIGNSYVIGAENEQKNIDLIKRLCSIMDKKLNKKRSSERLISFVKDRKGHDQRYSIDPTKIKKEIGWSPKKNFEDGLKETVNTFLNIS